jgi:hypothetical protein
MMMRQKTKAMNDNAAAPIDCFIDLDVSLSMADMKAMVSRIDTPTMASISRIKEILTPGAKRPATLEMEPAPI